MSLSTKIRSQYNELFVCCFELRAMMIQLIESAPQVKSPKDGIAYYIMAKVYKTFGVVIHLTKAGYTEDAEMLCRTMYDAFANLAIVLKDESDDTAWQYLGFDDVTRAKMHRNLKDRADFQEYFDQRKRNPKANDGPVEDFETKAAVWAKKYKSNSKNNWLADTPANKLAEKIGMQRYFVTVYEMESHLIHALPRVMNRYLSDNGEKIIMLLEPSDNQADMALLTAFDMAYQTSSKFNDYFGIQPHEWYRPLIERWTEAIKKIKDS